MKIDVFWSKVKRGKGCWEWQGSRDEFGYGIAVVRGVGSGAHRVAFILTYGYILPGIQVCHRCDNPPCVRPDHMFLGTPKDNATDKVRKGRSKGRIHPKRAGVVVIKPGAPLSVVAPPGYGNHIVYQGKTLCGYDASPGWPVVTPPYLAFWHLDEDCGFCLHQLQLLDPERTCYEWRIIHIS